MPEVVAVIPVKPFGVAKARLAPMLDAGARSRLGKAMAQRTAEQAAGAGAAPVVVTGDDGVAAWAAGLGLAVAVESGPGLDAAAATGRDMALADHKAWLVLHADLPLVTPADLRAVIGAIPGRGVALAPAVDGGTNAIGGDGPFPFSYGPASFHRHLGRAARRGPVAVVARPGLAVDVDRPADLALAVSHPSGSWLAPYLA